MNSTSQVKLLKSIKNELINVKKNENIRSELLKCQVQKFWRNFPFLLFVDPKTRFVSDNIGSRLM